MSKDYAGGARMGSVGNMRLLHTYGGHSNGSGTNKCFASGGKVHSDEAEDKKLIKKEVKASCMKAHGGEVDGESAKPRLDRPGRKMGGKMMGKKGDKGKKGGTNVNVIVMPKGGPDGGGAMPPMPMPPPGAGAAPPMPPPHMAGPPMMPPTAGGPPMPPMHKHGGKVGAYKSGGKVKSLHADGQETPAEAEAEKEHEGRKHGGKVHHKANGGHIHAEGQDDPTEAEAEREVESKKGGGKVHRMHRAEGGPAYSKMDFGAGGGKGRLNKIKAYGK